MTVDRLKRQSAALEERNAELKGQLDRLTQTHLQGHAGHAGQAGHAGSPSLPLGTGGGGGGVRRSVGRSVGKSGGRGRTNGTNGTEPI